MNSILRYPGGGAAGRILALPLIIAVLLLTAAMGWGATTASTVSGNTSSGTDYETLREWLAALDSNTIQTVTISSGTTKDSIGITSANDSTYSFTSTYDTISISGQTGGTNYQIGFNASDSTDRVMYFDDVDTVSLSNVDISRGGVDENNIKDFADSSTRGGAAIGVVNAADTSFTNMTISKNITNIGTTSGIGVTGAVSIRNTGAAGNSATFDRIILSDNKAIANPSGGNGTDATGGGATIVNVATVSYLNGDVIKNLAEYNNDNTSNGPVDGQAFGGGIAIRNGTNGTTATSVIIRETNFTQNIAKSSDSSPDVSNGNASGGGLYLNSVAGTYTLNLDGGDKTDNKGDFTKNKAETSVANAKAQGGAIHLESTHNGSGTYGSVNGSIKNTKFTQNTAKTTAGAGVGGMSFGGAVSINSANNGAVPALAFSGNTYDSNEAYSDNGHAYGGAVYSNRSVTFEKETFTGNKATATGNGDAIGGGLYMNSEGNTAKTLAVTNSIFNNNIATSAGSNNSYAYGGGLAARARTTTISNSTFERNQANANSSGGKAEGGAMWLASGNHNVADTTFKDNTANASNARGGAIYLDGGTLTATDTSFVHNQALGTNAKGGAIFANTKISGSGDTIITLNASAGKTMKFTDNYAGTAPNSVHFGINSASGTEHDARLNINVAANATMILANPVTAVLNTNNINVNVNLAGRGIDVDAGKLEWSGVNVFTTTGATTLTLDGGIVTFGDDFTAKADDTGNYTVDIKADTLLRVSATRGRNTSLAIFDFNENAPAGSRTFTVANSIDKIKLEVTTGRKLISDDWTLVIASGLTDNEMASAKANLIITSANSSLLTVDAIPVEREGNELVAHINFRSPYMDAGENARSALPALDQLIKVRDIFDNNYTHSDDQVNAILMNPWAATPEQYMDQARVMVQGVATVADLALKVGVRDPHRMSLAGDAYPTYEPVRYSTRAAPRLMDCYTPGIGLRFWAGYVGDFHKRDSGEGFNGYRADRHGFVAGLNYDFGTTGSVGLYGGYTNSETRARRISAKTEADTGHFGLVGRVSPIPGLAAFSLFGDAGYHFSGNETLRQLGGYQASGDFDQEAFTAAVGAEYDISLGNFDIVPYFRGRYTYLNQDSMSETGLTASHVDGFHEGAFTSRLGAEFSTNILFAGGVVSPTLNLAWNHEWGDRNFSTGSYYHGDPAAIKFAVSSTKPARDSMDIGVGAKAMLNIGGVPRVGVNVGYNLNLSKRTDTHSVHVAFELGF